jgi:hypothetical protein
MMLRLPADVIVISPLGAAVVVCDVVRPVIVEPRVVDSEIIGHPLKATDVDENVVTLRVPIPLTVMNEKS